MVYLLGVVVILVAPVVIGIFWGAPLIAREYETGTYHLAWNQSISPLPVAGGQAGADRAWPPWRSPKG